MRGGGLEIDFRGSFCSRARRSAHSRRPLWMLRLQGIFRSGLLVVILVVQIDIWKREFRELTRVNYLTDTPIRNSCAKQCLLVLD